MNEQVVDVRAIFADWDAVTAYGPKDAVRESDVVFLHDPNTNEVHGLGWGANFFGSAGRVPGQHNFRAMRIAVAKGSDQHRELLKLIYEVKSE